MNMMYTWKPDNTSSPPTQPESPLALSNIELSKSNWSLFLNELKFLFTGMMLFTIQRKWWRIMMEKALNEVYFAIR